MAKFGVYECGASISRSNVLGKKKASETHLICKNLLSLWFLYFSFYFKKYIALEVNCKKLSLSKPTKIDLKLCRIIIMPFELIKIQFCIFEPGGIFIQF